MRSNISSCIISIQLLQSVSTSTKYRPVGDPNKMCDFGFQDKFVSSTEEVFTFWQTLQCPSSGFIPSTYVYLLVGLLHLFMHKPND
jgi:hypothetical protein